MERMPFSREVLAPPLLLTHGTKAWESGWAGGRLDTGGSPLTGACGL